MKSDELCLCYVQFVGVDMDGKNIYDFLFTDHVDTFWFDNAEYKPMGLLNKNNIVIDDYQDSKRLVTEIKFDLIQDSTCFGYQDCIDGCVSISYENIDTYDSYPEDGRLVFHYGMTMDEVEELLAKKNLVFE